jgi:hypothetical protein
VEVGEGECQYFGTRTPLVESGEEADSRHRFAVTELRETQGGESFDRRVDVLEHWIRNRTLIGQPLPSRVSWC